MVDVLCKKRGCYYFYEYIFRCTDNELTALTDRVCFLTIDQADQPLLLELPPRLLAVFGVTSGSIWSSHKEDRQPREDTSGFLMHHHSREGLRRGRGCLALLNTAMRSRTTNSITFLFSREQTQQQHRITQHWLKRQQGICTLMSPTRLILALKMGNVGSYSFIFQPSISTS